MSNFRFPLQPDRDLRVAELRLSDPYAQARFSESIPPGAELVDLLNTYVFGRWPNEKMVCAKCRAKRHKHGFTAELSDGTRVPLGSKCGAELFGESWTQAEKRLGDRRRRQHLLRRLDYLIERLPEVRGHLRTWRATADTFRACRRRFEQTMHHLYGAVAHAARHEGGQLLLYRRQRNLAAEAQPSSGQPAFVHVTANVHTIRGREYFLPIDPVDAVEDAMELVEDIARAATNTAVIPTSQMQRLSKRFTTVINRLREVADMHDASFAFFEPTNLSGVARWATEAASVPGNYEANGSAIINSNGPVIMALVSTYPRLDRALLGLLNAAG